MIKHTNLLSHMTFSLATHLAFSVVDLLKINSRDVGRRFTSGGVGILSSTYVVLAMTS